MKKYLIGGFVGVIVGIVGGYFIGGMNCAKHYKNKIEELKEENAALLDELENVVGKQMMKDSKEGKTRKEVSNGEENTYREHAAVYLDPKDEEDERADIHIISEQQFKDDVNYRDNETLTWYKQDGILADSADMPIHSEEDVIGIEAMDKLEELGHDEFLYVENEIEDKLYEIAVEGNLSYYRDIVGG